MLIHFVACIVAASGVKDHFESFPTCGRIWCNGRKRWKNGKKTARTSANIAYNRRRFYFLSTAAVSVAKHNISRLFFCFQLLCEGVWAAQVASHKQVDLRFRCKGKRTTGRVSLNESCLRNSPCARFRLKRLLKTKKWSVY